MKPIAKRWTLLACMAAVLVLSETAPAAPPDPLLASRVIELVNAARQQSGRPPVTMNEKLMQVAQTLADDLARRRVVAHTDAAGKGIGERFLAMDYVSSLADEVISVGESTPETAAGNFLSRAADRETLLKPDVRDAGVGIAVGPGGTASGGPGTYWVIDLGLQVERGPGP